MSTDLIFFFFWIQTITDDSWVGNRWVGDSGSPLFFFYDSSVYGSDTHMFVSDTSFLCVNPGLIIVSADTKIYTPGVNSMSSPY